MTLRAKILALLAIVLGALGLRLWVAARPHVVQRDAIMYAALARALVEGEPRRALDHDYPPGYPLLVATAVRCLGTEDLPRSATDELAPFDPPTGPRLRDFEGDLPYLFVGSLVSAVLGALAVFPVYLLGRRVAARGEPAKPAAAANGGPAAEADAAGAPDAAAEGKPGAEPRILGRASARVLKSAAAAYEAEAAAKAEAAAAAEGRLAADRAGLLAAALLALHPLHAIYSGHILTEASFGFFLLAAAAATLAAAARVRPVPALLLGTVAGAAAGAAYAVRPEGLVLVPVAAALAAAARGPIAARAARVGALLVAFAAFAAPLVLDMNRPPEQPGPAGAEAAAPRARPAVALGEDDVLISKKKNPVTLLRAARDAPGEVARRVLGNAAKTFEVGHPLLVGAALGGAVLALLRRGAPRHAAIGILAVAAAYLFVYSLVRVDRRFALELSLLALPLAAPAAGALAAALGARIGGADRGALVTIAVAAVATVPVLLHKARDDKPHLVACARAIRDAADRDGIPRPVVLAEDVRLLYYSRGISPLPGLPIRAVDIEAELRAGNGDFVVLDGGAGPDRARAIRDAAESGLRAPLPAGLPRTARVVSVLEPLGEFKPPPGERGDIYLLYGFRRDAEILPGK